MANELSDSKKFDLPNPKTNRVRDVRISQRKSGGGGRKFLGTPSRSHRTAGLAGVPQAVVKVTGYSKHSQQRVKDHIAYITRHGELPLERENGDVLRGKATPHELVHAWGEKHLGIDAEASFADGRAPRKAAHLMLSSPKGTPAEKVQEIARDFLHRRFGEVTPYAFAVHEDTENLHAHVVLAMRGYDGKKVRIGKEEIQAMRELYAEVAVEHGVTLSASRRVDRGRDQATKTSHNNREYRLAKRGEVTVAFSAGVKRAYDELTGAAKEKSKGELRFDSLRVDAQEWSRRDAEHYRQEAQTNTLRSKDMERLAGLHEREPKAAGAPKSAREQFRELVTSVAHGEQSHPLDRRASPAQPTAGMRVLAEVIAKEKNLELPKDYASDFSAARAFLDAHARREIGRQKQAEKGSGHESEMDR